MSDLTCPRRMHEYGPWERVEWLDHWRPDDTCSFCGSYNPELLLMGIAKHMITLDPTDKNYKVYVNHKNNPTKYNKFYFMHFSEDQMKEFVDIYNLKPSIIEISGGDFYVMPFFMKRIPKGGGV